MRRLRTGRGTRPPAGPYLRNDGPDGGHIVLGRATKLFKVQRDNQRRPLQEPTWAICKYDSGQSRILLHGVNDAAAAEVAREFGIRLAHSRVATPFYSSPCFASLVEWVAENPRPANRMSQESVAFTYLGNWYEGALAAKAAKIEAASADPEQPEVEADEIVEEQPPLPRPPSM